MATDSGDGRLVALDRFVRRRQFVERLELVGPGWQRPDVIEALGEGWRLVRSGPYTTEALWPEVDPSRFLIVAEREVDVGDEQA